MNCSTEAQGHGGVSQGDPTRCSARGNWELHKSFEDSPDGLDTEELWQARRSQIADRRSDLPYFNLLYIGYLKQLDGNGSLDSHSCVWSCMMFRLNIGNSWKFHNSFGLSQSGHTQWQSLTNLWSAGDFVEGWCPGKATPRHLLQFATRPMGVLGDCFNCLEHRTVIHNIILILSYDPFKSHICHINHINSTWNI